MRTLLIATIALLAAASFCIWALAIGFSGTIPLWPSDIIAGLALYGPPAALAVLIAIYAKRWRVLAHDWIDRDASDQ